MKNTILCKDEELIEGVLLKFSKLINNTDFVLSIQRNLFFNDEPKIFDFSTFFSGQNVNSKKNIDNSGGFDLSKNKALFKSLGEATERYCLSYQIKEILSSYKEIKNRAINIFEFNDFSELQLSKPEYKQFLYNENDKFYWSWGNDFFTQKKIMIPSQLISVPYKYNNEKIIRYPITTGAACSTSLGGAIYRGICEIIERDAFMITYLNRLQRNQIDLNNSGEQLKNLNEMYSRYNLQLIIIESTTDLQIPSMIGLVIDKTGIGPAVSVGLAADLDPVKAAVKAAEEAIHSRPWIRKLMYKNLTELNLNTFEGRALYWSDPKVIKKLNFLIKNDNKQIVLKGGVNNISMLKKITALSKILKKHKLSTYFVDVTRPEIKKFGFYVVKTIIPQLQALYLYEDLKYLGNNRLISVPSKLGFPHNNTINNVPHPFL